jgi:hypothetical protein
VVAAEDHASFLVTSLQLESRRGLADLFEDELAVEPDPVLLDLHPRLLEGVPGALVEEVDADLLEDVHGLAVDRLHLVA